MSHHEPCRRRSSGSRPIGSLARDGRVPDAQASRSSAEQRGAQFAAAGADQSRDAQHFAAPQLERDIPGACAW